MKVEFIFFDELVVCFLWIRDIRRVGFNLANHVHQSHHVGALYFLFNLLGKLKNSSLFSNAFYLILNNITTSLLGFVFWNVMARVFTPDQVGIGSALVAASMLVGALANLGLGVGLVRFIPEVQERAVRLINSSFTLAGGLALAGSLIYLAGAGRWSPALSFVRENFWLLVLFMVFTAATSLSALTDLSLVAGRAARYVFFKNTLNSLIKLPLPVFVFASLEGFGIFAGTGVGFLAGVLLAWFLFLPSIYKGYRPCPIFEKDLILQVLPFSFASYIANLLNQTPQFIYPLMVLNVLGAEKNAYFYIAWMMTMVLAVIPNGMAQSLLAEGSHDPQKLGQNGRRALAFALLLSLPAVGGMNLVGGWFLHFFGPGYAEHGTGVVRFLALAVIPQCVNMLFIAVNQVKKRVYLIIVQTGMLSVIALGLGYWLLGEIGLNGVGIAYALAHFLVALVVIIPLWKSLKQKINVKAPETAGEK